MSHHLTIAKATFAASLLRPDVTKVNRDDLPQFHQKLEEVVLKCTPSTIQNCKQWLLEHIIPSAQRSAAFGRYLSAYSRYLSKPDTQNGPCISRQRLHLIYLLNDILHHAKHHTTNPTAASASPSPFEPILHELFRDAASEQRRGISKRLEDILSIWEQNEYLPRSLWLQLNAAVTDPASAETTQQPSHTTSLPKETPYMMPFLHGDPSLPFYELPAGNFIPHILPNRKVSMRPDSIKPLQFAAGPADDALVNAVKDFLKDVERIDPTQVIEDEGVVADIDDLGQLSYRNEAGDVVGDTYYGWSRAFCNRMESRNRSRTNGSRERSRSRSYSRSRSRSRGPRLGKRRYSRSSSDQSKSRSRSRLRNRSFADYQRSDREFRTPSPRRFGQPAVDEPSKIASNQFSHQTPSITGPSHTYPGFTPFQPPPLMPGNVPVPPPRPPNWPAGAPWPPPPPPPPAGRSNGFPVPIPHPPGQHHANPGQPPIGPYYR